MSHSALLALFGASHTALKVGNFRGQAVSFEALIDFTRELDEVIVHSGEINFEEDDDVSRRDFEDHFEVIENILELPRLMHYSKWLDQINDDNISCEFWSLDSALEEALVAAWGQVVWDEETVSVGYVNGNEINRRCRIATRLVE